MQTHTMTIHTEFNINRRMDANRPQNRSPGCFGTALRSILKNAPQCNGRPPGSPILRPLRGQFPIDLGLGVYGHGVRVCVCVCVHSLQYTPSLPKCCCPTALGVLVVSKCPSPGREIHTPPLLQKRLDHSLGALGRWWCTCLPSAGK